MATVHKLSVDISVRQILKIAAPIAFAMLIPQINFIANTIFLSRLGETELATAGITGVYYMVFALIGNGLNSGLQALISRRAGENKPYEMGKLYIQSIYITLCIGILAIILNYISAYSFLSTVLHSKQVQHEAVGFLLIRAWGLPFLYLFQCGNAMLVASNNSHLLKYGFLGETIVNVFLDYVLIYGNLGFPQCGFNGAAYASIIAEATGFMIVALIFYMKKFNQRFGFGYFLRPNFTTVRIIFKQSLPLIFQFTFSVGAWLIFYILIEHHGERKLAISNTIRNILAVFGIFTWSFANTTNMMVSNIIGQQKQDLVLFLVKKIARLSISVTFLLCLLLNLFPNAILGIYKVDPSFISETIPVLRIITLSTLIMSLAVVWLNSVTGTGNTRINLLIEIIALSIYLVYVYLALNVLSMSLVIAWASEIFYWCITLLLAFLYMKSNRWKAQRSW